MGDLMEDFKLYTKDGKSVKAPQCEVLQESGDFLCKDITFSSDGYILLGFLTMLLLAITIGLILKEL